jgi:hypothetical protein
MQEQSIPVALGGRDILARAKNGPIFQFDTDITQLFYIPIHW